MRTLKDLRTLKEISKEEVLNNLSDKLNMSKENIEFINAFKPIIEEMTFDKEIDLMILDITRAYKEEMKNENLTLEAQEIIGGLIEIVHMLYGKRVKE